jgi:epoxyqueuosine reductase QueG
MNLAEEITKLFKTRGNYITGFANLKGLLENSFSEYNYAISIARKMDYDVINKISSGPTKRYLALYRKVNLELTERINELSGFLDKRGIENLPIKPTLMDEELDSNYLKTLRTPFSHKMAATRAGIGWIGKTALLVTKEYGPRVRLATVLLNCESIEIGERKAKDKSRCGKCIECVEQCPAQAANGVSWDIHTDRDVFFDAFKCREKCRELSRKNLNENISICGICISVCPIGIKK